MNGQTGGTHTVDDDGILRLQREFDAAELEADAQQLNALLADDFLSIGERGYVLDKQQWIARHQDFRYLALESTQTDVRHYRHTAIVRYVQYSRATWLGQALTLSVRLSQVWVEQPGGWQLAALQFSSLDRPDRRPDHRLGLIPGRACSTARGGSQGVWYSS